MKNHRIIISSIIIITTLIWVLIQINKSTDKYRYGNSYRQNNIINTIRLHKYGITGKNITIGIIDAGFYTPHPVFANTRILKEFDFVTNKPTTLNYGHIRGLDHGTNVFSVVGGYKINELIGTAYGANFILAKTDISTERLVEEEQNAVKASKWLFENGANIITTSLSFNKFDNAYYYYPYQMDGTIAAITKTADSLVNKGVVFICSAGNNYEEAWHIIEPPGDGFNVLSVGSIDKNLIHSFFSSCGPTIDGRIKPDIVTPGEGVWNANYLPKIKPEFSWNHGTSLSAPIAAGIAALVLSTHPDLSSFQIIEAIKKTSSKSNSPDTLYGWGIPDAEKAVSYFGPAFSNTPELDLRGDELEIKTYVFSSYGLDYSSVEIHLLENDQKKESVYRMKKTENNYYTCTVNITLSIDTIGIYFKAKDIRGRSTKYPSGILGDYLAFQKINGKLEDLNKH
ncbi:MAG: S8 family serine peptidase [Ignavibacteriaceae bacterium]|nr:S8 family serine peptidase [Ignavibacteriaceae bacterium]